MLNRFQYTLNDDGTVTVLLGSFNAPSTIDGNVYRITVEQLVSDMEKLLGNYLGEEGRERLEPKHNVGITPDEWLDKLSSNIPELSYGVLVGYSVIRSSETEQIDVMGTIKVSTPDMMRSVVSPITFFSIRSITEPFSLGITSERKILGVKAFDLMTADPEQLP